jgi:acetolactate synthase I/II/III large subunit
VSASTQRKQSVADAIAEAVRYEGVTAAFGLVGEGNIAVVEQLIERGGIEWYAARREDAAVLMADGYARRTGAVGFATITHGPGVTNAATALTEASRARTPLVVLAGDTARNEPAHPQAIDVRAVVSVTGARTRVIQRAADAADDVEAAFASARRDGPIVLILASDLAEEKATLAPVREHASPPGTPGPHRPDNRALAAVVDLVSSAKRPVVLAGRGVVTANARDEVTSLGDAIGALFATTLLSRGLFADNPWNLGFAGGFGEALANELLADADLILAFGTSLSEYTSKGGHLFERAKVVRFDLDERADVVGDVRASAVALRAAVRSTTDPVGYRTAQVRAVVAARNQAGADEDGLDATNLAVELDALLPTDRTVVVDLGYFTAEACRYIRIPAPRQFLFPLNFGSIGLALATGAGAAAADRKSPTVACVGDGGLMAAIGELETLRRHSLPLTVVVFNDSAYGVEYHAARVRGTDPAIAQFDDVDFAAVARGFGVQSATVRTLGELRALQGQLGSADRPFLLDAKIDGTVETPWLKEIIAAGWHQCEGE